MRIAKWNEYQSYRQDRGQPPWIKVHRRLMRNHQWVVMSASERGQLVAMWLLAADNDGWLPDDPDLIGKLCYMQPPDIERFVSLGFIELDANMTPDRRQSDPPDKRRVEQKRVEAESRRQADANVESQFAVFWERYPRKVAKPKAFIAFKKALKQAPLQTILNGVENYKAAVAQINQRKKHTDKLDYCHPTTWLNQGRWEDDESYAAPDMRDPATAYLDAKLEEELNVQTSSRQSICDQRDQDVVGALSADPKNS